MPTPSGCAVCRTPIATPRSCAANQPITTRPLAALTDAPAAPASPSSTTNPVMPCTSSTADATSTPHSPSPTAITTRSP